MGRVRVERLRIETTTSAGLFGLDIVFDKGLNVIHAENTLGKSSCLQAIIFALGLEGTLGPSRAAPLKPALTRELRTPDGSIAVVMESRIYLQLVNEQEFQITVRRSSVDAEKGLVTVWEGKGIGPGLDRLPYSDYFVRVEGAAVRERGFHAYLSQFFDLQLPQVLKYDGSDCPLYLEAVFAVNYVEQTRGWGGILNVLPTYLGIQDLAQQIIEFTLALDAQELRGRKRRANEELKALAGLWSDNIARISELASTIGGSVEDLPNAPHKVPEGGYLGTISLTVEDEIVPLEDALEKTKQALESLRLQDVPTVSEAAEGLRRELDEKEIRLREMSRAVAALYEDMDAAAQYVNSIDIRVDALRESLRKYKDVKRLIQIGSKEKFKFLQRVCPTCGQTIADTLLPHVHDHEVLGIDDNIVYLEKQIKTLTTLHLSEEKRSADKKRALANAKREIDELRSSIRTLKDSLISPGRAPSKEAIRKEIALEERVDELTDANTRLGEIKTDQGAILKRWRLTESQLDAMPSDSLSTSDHNKLKALEQYFKTLLQRFGYKSTSTEELRLSERSYRPSLENVELGSEASASDNIRMIWAYLYALLLIDQKFPTNHLGVLLLDEPRQQEADKASFETFVHTAAATREFDQQVIVTTSESFHELQAAIEGHEIRLIHFDGELIAPLQPL